jgi:hypothetical protein
LFSHRADAGEDFFENLSKAEAMHAADLSRASTLSPRPHTAGDDHGEAGESEGEIQRALFVSNHSVAVDICLQVRVCVLSLPALLVRVSISVCGDVFSNHSATIEVWLVLEGCAGLAIPAFLLGLSTLLRWHIFRFGVAAWFHMLLEVF